MRTPTLLKVSLLLLFIMQQGIPQVFADSRANNLIVKYKSAHEDGDLEQIQTLVVWGQAGKRTREKTTQRLSKYLHLPIKEIEYRPAPDDYVYQFYGATPTLKPIGWLAVSFTDPNDESRYRGVSFIVGEHGDVYAITVAQ